MKTVRILLYPDTTQEEMLIELTMKFIEALIEGVRFGQIELRDLPDCFSQSTKLKLMGEIRRKQNQDRTLKIARPYCRFGEDYVLEDTLIHLPIKGNEFLSIVCILRPFQTILLDGKHPKSLVIKRMKKHWFAYLWVEESENSDLLSK